MPLFKKNNGKAIKPGQVRKPAG